MRPPPDRLERLPPQYFAGAARAGHRRGGAGGRAGRRPRAREPGGRAAGARRSPASPRRRATRARTATRPSAGCRSCAPRSRAATARATASSSTPTARSPSSRARRRRSSSSRSCSPGAATRCCSRTRATRTTARASRSRARASRRVPLDPDAGWAPDLAEAPPRRRRLYLNYPSNPCAAAAPPGLFAAAVAWAERTGGAVVHDFAYGDLVFDGRRRELPRRARRARGRRRAVHACRRPTGWPAGGSASSSAPPSSSSASTCSRITSAPGIFRPVQEAAIAALTGPEDSVDERRERYRRAPRPRARRAPGLREPSSEATFYVWVELPRGLTRRRAARRPPARRRAGRGLRRARRGLGAALARGLGRDARARARAAGARSRSTRSPALARTSAGSDPGPYTAGRSTTCTVMPPSTT